MDSENEKTFPEKSSTITSDDNVDNPQNKNASDHQSISPPPPLSEPSTEINEPKPENPIQETDIQEEPSTEIATNEPEPDSEPSLSPLPPDLDKLSEEIDEYISILSNFTNDKTTESTPPDVHISVEQFLVLVEAKINKYDSPGISVKWSQLTDYDTSSFLEGVDRISKLSTTLYNFSSQLNYKSSFNHVSRVLQRAMSYLEEELRLLLEDLTNQSSEPEPTEEKKFPEHSEEIASNLNKLVNALITGGHAEECYHVYLIARRTALDETLHKHGYEKCSMDDVQKMNWESLEREITTWNRIFKEFATCQFPNEHKLLNAVFKDNPVISRDLFRNISRVFVILFLNFAESVSMTKRSSEKIFKFLDMYETLRDSLPEIEKLLPDEYADELKSDSVLTKGRLGDTIITIFCELENSIYADSGKTPVAGGAVHPLTRYILNYLNYLCDEYKDTLDQIFRDHQNLEAFQIQMIKVMDLLDSNLKAKSNLYKDIPLSQIFLMNNGRYILQKIRGSSGIKSILGDTWCRKRSTELRNYHKNYQRETWGKVLNCLTNHEGLNVHGKVVKPVLKERFKSFNAMFEEIHKIQSTWIISDEQLQSELRVSISNMVVPAYRSFMGKYSQHLTAGRQTEKYVKFQPDDVESYIDELFDGNARK